MNLKDLLPSYYDNVYEINELINAENKEFQDFDDTTNRALLNQFVMLADESGIDTLESQYGIQSSSSESIENRRYNLLTRLLPPKPITKRYFEELIASLNIKAETKINAMKQSFVAVLNAENITDDQIDKSKNLMNVYLPANLTSEILEMKYGETDMNRFIGTANSLKIIGASVCHDNL